VSGAETGAKTLVEQTQDGVVSAEVWVFDVAGLGGDGRQKRDGWVSAWRSMFGVEDSGTKRRQREPVDHETSSARSCRFDAKPAGVPMIR